MKLWFKQLFCSHIWKTIGKDYLRSNRWLDRHSLKPVSDWHDYYALRRECIHCGKKRTTEQAELRGE